MTSPKDTRSHKYWYRRTHRHSLFCKLLTIITPAGLFIIAELQLTISGRRFAPSITGDIQLAPITPLLLITCFNNTVLTSSVNLCLPNERSRRDGVIKMEQYISGVSFLLYVLAGVKWQPLHTHTQTHTEMSHWCCCYKSQGFQPPLVLDLFFFYVIWYNLLMSSPDD